MGESEGMEWTAHAPDSPVYTVLCDEPTCFRDGPLLLFGQKQNP